MYFAAVVKPDLWQNAMQAEGLTLEDDGAGGWSGRLLHSLSLTIRPYRTSHAVG